jgi:phosphatidylserine decarboxylase
VAPPGEHLVLSPADGTVVDIAEVDEREFIGGPALRVGIFLSVFSVHVNRAPVAGTVRHLHYRRGRKHAAFRAKAAYANESNSIGLESLHCAGRGAPVRVLVRQIAGVLARRIVCTCRKADRLARGERVGMIKFGSRTELYLPCAAVAGLRVKVGDRVRGGSSVLGVLVNDSEALLRAAPAEETAGATTGVDVREGRPA